MSCAGCRAGCWSSTTPTRSKTSGRGCRGGPLPAGIPGHVIVTTRRGGFAALGQVLELDVIDLPAAVTLLRTRVPQLDLRTSAGRSPGSWARLPLALEQAAAYLDRVGDAARRLPGVAAPAGQGPVCRGARSAGRGDTIATLWDITFERISAEQPAAVVLLDLCAYLAPELIPLDLFTAHPWAAAPAARRSRGRRARRSTTSSLHWWTIPWTIAPRPGLQLHRLVQGVIRARHPAKSLPPGLDRQHHDHRHPGKRRILWAAVGGAGAAAADAPRRVMGAPESWPRWAVLLPHVLAATARLDPATAGETAVLDDASWLLDRPEPTCRCTPGLMRPGRCTSGPWPSPRPPADPTTPCRHLT